MQLSQAVKNRQAALQLTSDVTAVPLATHVILQDFAQLTTVIGRDDVMTVLHTFFSKAFVDMEIEVNALLADNDTATMSLSISGQQIAPFWGLPCTGRQVTLFLAIICRFRAGLLTSIELFYDAGTLLRQLGLAI